jgi:hypothetical protein
MAHYKINEIILLYNYLVSKFDPIYPVIASQLSSATPALLKAIQVLTLQEARTPILQNITFHFCLIIQKNSIMQLQSYLCHTLQRGLQLLSCSRCPIGQMITPR